MESANLEDHTPTEDRDWRSDAVVLICSLSVKELAAEGLGPDHYVFATASFAAAVPRYETGGPSYPLSRILVLLVKKEMQMFEVKGRFY